MAKFANQEYITTLLGWIEGTFKEAERAIKSKGIKVEINGRNWPYDLAPTDALAIRRLLLLDAAAKIVTHAIRLRDEYSLTLEEDLYTVAGVMLLFTQRYGEAE